MVTGQGRGIKGSKREIVPSETGLVKRKEAFPLGCGGMEHHQAEAEEKGIKVKSRVTEV